MDNRERLRLAYRDKFRSTFGHEFQAWFEKVLRAVHSIGDFQPIRQTSGDGGIDGFVIESQLVYQIYAPARILELRDSETARKIRRDFGAALGCLGPKLKAWCFVHNHPDAAIGQKTTGAVAELREEHDGVAIRIYDIESSWQQVAQLAEATIAELLGISILEDPLRLVPQVPEVETTGRDLDILLASNRSIPLVGREEELSSLCDWLDEPEPVSVRVITGPAGAGKTRLAIEFTERASSKGWHGGFLPPYQNLMELHWPQPLVVVVENAATKPKLSQVVPWLEFLLGTSRQTRPKLRVLLLEREASLKSGWLLQVTDVAKVAEPKRVAPIHSLDLRRSILEATLARLALNARLPQDTVFADRLAARHFCDPLTLMMAALVANKTGLVEALSLSREDLAEELAKWEERRLRKFAPPALQPLLLRLAGMVTVCRQIKVEELLEVATEEGNQLGRQFPAGPGEAVDVVMDALGCEGKPKPVQPDVVGEAFLLNAFGGENLEAGKEALLRAALRYPAEVCDRLARTAQDFASDRRPDPLLWMKAILGHGVATDIGLLWDLVEAMPIRTLVLRELAADANGLLIAQIRTRPSKEIQSEEVQAELARILSNLSFRLSDLGRREEALECAREAYTLLQQFGKKRPRDLAACLHNFARSLSDLGRPEEALEFALQAVSLLEQQLQAPKRADAYLPDLARSLGLVAVCFDNLGRKEEALEHSYLAVALYRQLVRERTDTYLPDLAGALSNLAKFLNSVSRHEEGLERAQEALDLRQQLAARLPDASLADLAFSLNNVAVSLNGLGQSEEGLKRAEEALALHRQLNELRPQEFLPDLARSLITFSKCSGHLGHREEALAAAREAVALYRRLATLWPDTFPANLAMALQVMSICLGDVGRPEEAVELAREAVAVCRQLAVPRPDAFSEDLAGSLSSLGELLTDAGRPNDALEQAQEAVAIYRQLPTRSGDHSRALASSLNNLARTLGELGYLSEALAQAEEALALRRKLAISRRGALLPELARSLLNVGGLLMSLGRRDEAVAHAQEAVALYRQLVLTCPPAFLPNLAMSLNNIAYMSAQPAQAMESFAEGLKVLVQSLNFPRRAYAPLMTSMVRGYIRLANPAGNTVHGFANRESRLIPEIGLAIIDSLNEAIAILRTRVHTEQHSDPASELDMVMELRECAIANLINHGVDLAEDGYLNESLTALRNARHVLHRISKDEHTSDLSAQMASVIMNQGETLRRLGQISDAMVAFEDAIRIRRFLIPEEKRPAERSFLQNELARAITRRAITLGQLSRPDESSEAFAEAIALRRRLVYEEDRSDFEDDLSNSILAWAHTLGHSGRYDEATTVYEQAICVQRDILKKEGLSRQVALARSYFDLAGIRERAGDVPGSLASAREARQLLEELVHAGFTGTTQALAETEALVDRLSRL